MPPTREHMARSYVRDRVLASLPILEKALLKTCLINTADELEAAIREGFAQAMADYRGPDSLPCERRKV